MVSLHGYVAVFIGFRSSRDIIGTDNTIASKQYSALLNLKRNKFKRKVESTFKFPAD